MKAAPTPCTSTSTNLHKYFKPELREAGKRLNQLIGGTLAAKALAGDVTSCIFWLKCKGGFRDRGSDYAQQGGRVVYGWADDVDAAAQPARVKKQQPADAPMDQPAEQPLNGAPGGAPDPHAYRKPIRTAGDRPGC